MKPIETIDFELTENDDWNKLWDRPVENSYSSDYMRFSKIRYVISEKPLTPTT